MTGPQIVGFIGIDGSGKSALASNIREHLQNAGFHVRYVHSFHNPFLLKPIKWLVRHTFMRHVDQFGDYSRYRMRKSQVVSYHSTFSFFYGGLWLLDYTLQALFPIALHMLRKEVLILDRYIYDAVINMSLSLGWTEERAWRMIDNWLRFFPTPDRIFLIDVPECVAFSRKKDIPSVDYLSERRKWYLALANRYDIDVINGEQPLDKSEEVIKLALGV